MSDSTSSVNPIVLAEARKFHRERLTRVLDRLLLTTGERQDSLIQAMVSYACIPDDAAQKEKGLARIDEAVTIILTDDHTQPVDREKVLSYRARAAALFNQTMREAYTYYQETCVLFLIAEDVANNRQLT